MAPTSSITVIRVAQASLIIKILLSQNSVKRNSKEIEPIIEAAESAFARHFHVEFNLRVIRRIDRNHGGIEWGHLVSAAML